LASLCRSLSSRIADLRLYVPRPDDRPGHPDGEDLASADPRKPGGLPFSDHPFGVGSIFIIDPLYTLPLLIGLGVAVRARRPSHRAWNLAGLFVSSAGLVWLTRRSLGADLDPLR